MSYLNYEFFDEFKALDNLCRDIYGQPQNGSASLILVKATWRMYGILSSTSSSLLICCRMKGRTGNGMLQIAPGYALDMSMLVTFSMIRPVYILEP